MLYIAHYRPWTTRANEILYFACDAFRRTSKPVRVGEVVWC